MWMCVLHRSRGAESSSEQQCSPPGQTLTNPHVAKGASWTKKGKNCLSLCERHIVEIWCCEHICGTLEGHTSPFQDYKLLSNKIASLKKSPFYLLFQISVYSTEKKVTFSVMLLLPPLRETGPPSVHGLHDPCIFLLSSDRRWEGPKRRVHRRWKPSKQIKTGNYASEEPESTHFIPETCY